MDLGLPPDPDGVTEGFATLEEMQRIAPETKVDRRHRQRGAQERAEGDRQRRLRFLREAGRARGAAHDRRARPAAASAGGGEPAAGRDAGPFADRAHRHREPGDAEGVPRRREARDHQRAGAAARRKRHGQGGAGAGAARARPARASSRSSPSTAARSRRTCWKASCSATSAAPSPAR